MKRPCSVCGPLGTQKDGYTLGHTATCSPQLRALVRAALAWAGPGWSIERATRLLRAVNRFDDARASREKEK